MQTELDHHRDLHQEKQKNGHRLLRSQNHDTISLDRDGTEFHETHNWPLPPRGDLAPIPERADEHVCIVGGNLLHTDTTTSALEERVEKPDRGTGST